jgi:hypothetical protein
MRRLVKDMLPRVRSTHRCVLSTLWRVVDGWACRLRRTVAKAVRNLEERLECILDFLKPVMIGVFLFFGQR